MTHSLRLLVSASLILRAEKSHDAAVAFGVLVTLAVSVFSALIPLTAWGAHRRGRGKVAALVPHRRRPG
jgi:hypothetical protein